MQSLYNEEQRKKLQNTTTVRTILKSLNALSVARIFCLDLRKLRLLCKLPKIWSVDSQDNYDPLAGLKGPTSKEGEGI